MRIFFWSILGSPTVGWWGGIFGEFSVALDPIFCILYSFFYVLRNCVKQLRRFLLKVKMKTLFERCLSNYTLMEIFSVFLFNILWNILQIFMFFVGLLYTLLINNLLITTTDTYRLYISNTFYCNKQWECNSNNNKRSAGCVIENH